MLSGLKVQWRVGGNVQGASGVLTDVQYLAPKVMLTLTPTPNLFLTS